MEEKHNISITQEKTLLKNSFLQHFLDVQKFPMQNRRYIQISVISMEKIIFEQNFFLGDAYIVFFFHDNSVLGQFSKTNFEKFANFSMFRKKNLSLKK